MRRGLLVGSVCAVFAAGAAASAPPAGVLGVATYMQGPGDFGFEASRFVRLDARLRPRPGGLRLGDGMTSSVPSPDRRMFAVGTANFGEIVVVDPAKLRRVATTYTVGRSPRLNYETRVVNWPRPHLLVALVSPAPGKYPVASALLLCDPLRGKVLREIPFGGGADGLAAGDFSAFLVGALRGRIRAPSRRRLPPHPAAPSC
jgi:hypothetical protein